MTGAGTDAVLRWMAPPSTNALSFPDARASLVIANSLGGAVDADYVAMGRRIGPAPQFDALPVQFRELGPSYRAVHPGGARHWLALAKPGLKTVKVPALPITGDADLYTPPPVLKMFAQRIKGASNLIVPECGHSACWEQPEICNRAVLDFVRRN